MKVRFETKDIDATNVIAVGQENDKTFCVISPNLDLGTAFQLLHTLSLHMLNAYTISANGGQLPEKPKEEELKKFIAIKQELYEMYNLAVSSVLEHYAPEFELRPDVTADAIANEEERIVKEKYKHLTKEEKMEANKNIQKFKKDLLKKKMSSKAKTAKEIEDAAKKVS